MQGKVVTEQATEEGGVARCEFCGKPDPKDECVCDIHADHIMEVRCRRFWVQ